MGKPAFSVVIFTAAPAGLTDEGVGALQKIDGREIVLRAVELFLNRDEVTQVVVVFDPAHLDEAKRKLGGHFGLTGVKLAGGGPRPIDQLAAAVEKIQAHATPVTRVIVHDGARPAVPFGDIDRLLQAAETDAAVALSTRVRSTVIELDGAGAALRAIEPNRAAHLLTPQAFSKERFLEIAKTLVEPSPQEFALVGGSGMNVRMSAPSDASLVKAMLNLMPKPKIKAPENPFEEAQW